MPPVAAGSMRITYSRLQLLLVLLGGVLPAWVAATWKGEGLPLEYFIMEELPAGQLIGNVAVDYKLNDKFNTTVQKMLRYSIDEEHSTKHHFFTIEDDTSIVSTRQIIDRDSICPGENVCLAWLHIHVSPEGINDDIRIMMEIVDKNDNQPTFEDPSVALTVLESAPVGTIVSLPTATDPDSGRNAVRTYELVGDTDMFDLVVTREEAGRGDEPVTKVGLEVVSRVDRERGSFYSLRLVAHDHGIPPRSGTLMINITIGDINDHDPRFDNATYVVSVRENAPSGTAVIVVQARDFDLGANAAISYSFDQRTIDVCGDLFEIARDSGAITTKMPIDFEKGSMYLLVVTARDQGVESKLSEATVIVRVIDENDNAPVVMLTALSTAQSGKIEMAEDVPVNTIVARLSASDQDGGDNGRVDCFLEDEWFGIKRTHQAQFQVVILKQLDREVHQEVALRIECRDRGARPNVVYESLVVHITDVNDNAPVFSRTIYNVRLNDNQPNGQPFLTVKAEDPDKGLNGEVRYYLPESDTFAIETRTGAIFLRTELSLDDNLRLRLLVVAKDKGSPVLSSTATVLISRDSLRTSWLPSFSQPNYEFGVYENFPSGTEVGIIALSASRSADFVFSFTEDSSDAGDMFIIDAQSGTLTTKTSFDREERPVYYMAVKAVSRSEPAASASVSVTVYIADKNDNGPTFIFPSDKNHTVVVPSDASIHSPVATIRASDPDLGGNSKLTYAITGGSGANIFTIQPHTGRITLTDSLERPDTAPSYRLQVQVKDGGYPPFLSNCNLDVVIDRKTASAPVVDDGSGQKRGDVVDSSHATIVVAVTAASLITVFLVLFGVMVFLIWRRLQPAKGQSDRYTYSNMEPHEVGFPTRTTTTAATAVLAASGTRDHAPTSTSISTSSSPCSRRGKVSPRASGAGGTGGVDRTAASDCRQLDPRQKAAGGAPYDPKCNTIKAADFCVNIDRQRPPLARADKAIHPRLQDSSGSTSSHSSPDGSWYTTGETAADGKRQGVLVPPASADDDCHILNVTCAGLDDSVSDMGL